LDFPTTSFVTTYDGTNPVASMATLKLRASASLMSISLGILERFLRLGQRIRLKEPAYTLTLFYCFSS
jgi:hypothetical protein